MKVSELLADLKNRADHFPVYCTPRWLPSGWEPGGITRVARSGATDRQSGGRSGGVQFGSKFEEVDVLPGVIGKK